ncbi:hypothetical protein K4F52_000704 [Lecanicillium sp. MT-2017a]|nr:hypothetical protein K4F52_000704 [Lecanicillium sp. MT-2017a]
MAPNKDMRRQDLIVPFQEPKNKKDPAEFGSTLASTMPMAAMFTRNKFVGWAGFVFALQTWLGQSAEASANSPGYLSVGLSLMALGVSYMPLFMPPPSRPGMGSGTEAPAPLAA